MADRDRKDMKVLVIDDDQDLTEVLKALLEGIGFGEILIAVDGEEGYLAAQQHQPDLILLDLIMPGMDGPRTLEVLESDDRTVDIPVIVQTSLLTEKDVIEKEGMLHGRPCVSKPYQVMQIEVAIQRALSAE